MLGGGVAGLASAISSARQGHQVTLLERDAPPPPPTPEEAPSWERRGIPHFLMPHAFLARGVVTLRNEAPDVYAALLDAGAIELKLAEKIPPDARLPEDEDLVFLGCRRPVIEWVLRRAANSEPGVTIRPGTAVLGITWAESGVGFPRACGVVTRGDEIPADLVIDATGRSSKLREWIVDGGGSVGSETESECGLVYYSRYYRFRPEQSRPDGPCLFGPRAELGYMESGTFWGDNDTFSIVHTILPTDRELRALRDPAAFTACLRSIPVFQSLIDDEVAEPITPVGAMGQLRNARRSFVKDGRPVATGVIALGDALAHTNPRYAWGLSISLIHAFTLGRLLRQHPNDVETLALEFDAATRDDIAAAYGAATATDAARDPYWRGEVTDIRTPTEETLPLFLLWLLPMAGMKDPEIFRRSLRRLMFLDRPQDLESDHDLISRGAGILRAMETSSAPSSAGPSRSDMIKIVQSARSAG